MYIRHQSTKEPYNEREQTKKKKDNKKQKKIKNMR